MSVTKRLVFYSLLVSTILPAGLRCGPARAEDLRVTPVVPIVYMGYSIRPTGLTVFSGDLYFSSMAPGKGVELWKFDGTEARVIADINPQGNSSPENLIVHQDELYFAADDGTHGRELWKFDGTNASIVQDLIPGSLDSWLSSAAVFNNELHMAGTTPLTGRELLKTDGSRIVLASDPPLGPGSGIEDPPELTVYAGDLYFKAKGITPDYLPRLWKFDGTTASVVSSSVTLESPYAALAVFKGKLYFAESGGGRLYSYDGSEVALAADVAWIGVENIAQTIPYKNELIFTAHASPVGRELWRFDGEGASLLADINPGSYGSSIQDLVVAGGDLYFAAQDGGWAIWRYDGETVAAVPGTHGLDYPAELTLHGTDLYFVSSLGDDYWLYKIEGVPEPGTIVLLATLGPILLAAYTWRRHNCKSDGQ